jgi:hypothetical protein
VQVFASPSQAAHLFALPARSPHCAPTDAARQAHALLISVCKAKHAHDARQRPGAHAPNQSTMRPTFQGPTGRTQMTIGTILLIVLILLLIGALPSWPYSSGWGYRPTGLVGVVLIIVIVLLLMGRI